MKRYFFIFALLLLLINCATMYKPRGLMGGYSHTSLDKNLFRVTFIGNGYTSQERALDFAYLRCSELVLTNGFKYFVIVNANSYISKSTYRTPTKTKTSGQVQLYDNYAYGSATSTTTGGQVYNIRKPRVIFVILCFKDKPNVSATIFNASYVKKSIKSKYDLK